MDILSFILGYIKGKSQGGGGNVDGDIDAINDRLDAILGEVVGENQYTVTFIGADGSTLCSIIVVEGDDCADPVSTGLISKPTKATTAQYTYSYSGWSLTSGGSKNNNALKEITENKTVYAAFTATVRKYTVNFYDGNTLLKTEQIAYGGSSTYTYKKEHHIFHGWSPEPTNITGAMDCYAQLEECYTFADASWEYIADISARGLASEVFAVGDTRTESIDGVNRTLIIADIGYDYIGEERGTNCITILGTDYSRKFGKTSAWHEGELGTYLTSTFYSELSPELKAVMKPALKKYRDASDTATIVSDYFPLWIFSVGELKNGSGRGYDERYADRPYAVFTDNTASKNLPISNSNVWLRSIGFTSTDSEGNAYILIPCYAHIVNSQSTGLSVTIEGDYGDREYDSSLNSIMYGFCV